METLSPDKLRRIRQTNALFLRHIVTPTPAIAERIAEIAGFLSDKGLSAAQHNAITRLQQLADPVAEADALDIAAPFYRAASRQIADELAASINTADRAYAAFASPKIDTDTPAEARSRFRLLTIQRDRGDRGRSGFALERFAAGDL